jgi:hypothetical protein
MNGHPGATESVVVGAQRYPQEIPGSLLRTLPLANVVPLRRSIPVPEVSTDDAPPTY